MKAIVVNAHIKKNAKNTPIFTERKNKSVPTALNKSIKPQASGSNAGVGTKKSNLSEEVT